MKILIAMSFSISRNSKNESAIPPADQRLQQVDDIFAVKQCPHCEMYWQRDVNACRNIGVIFFSLQQNLGRPAIYGGGHG